MRQTGHRRSEAKHLPREHHQRTNAGGGSWTPVRSFRGSKPGLLILYHRANPGCDQARTEECREAGSEEQLLKEIRQVYKGNVVAGHDLEAY